MVESLPSKQVVAGPSPVARSAPILPSPFREGFDFVSGTIEVFIRIPSPVKPTPCSFPWQMVLSKERINNKYLENEKNRTFFLDFIV
jgi:hypothetical protein